MADFAEEFSFLNIPDLDPELKKVLIEQVYLERSQLRELEHKAKEAGLSQTLEKRRFWHNTPLVVALVGTITIAANALSSYFLSNQTTDNTERIKSIEAQIAETGKTADAGREASKEERAFAFSIIERELAKSNDLAARASVLLFLVRAGVLNSLNRDELERMAINDLEKAGESTETIGIPQTFGLGSPNYDLESPTIDPRQTSAAGALLAVATTEINRDIEESTSYQEVEKYWNSIGAYKPRSLGPETDWSGAFIFYLIKEAGNPNKIKPSASDLEIWYDARAKGITFLPRERQVLPGDLVFFARRGQDVNQFRVGSGRLVPAHSGVVLRVNGSAFEAIEANVANALRLRPHDVNDPNVIGFARIGLAPGAAIPRAEEEP